MRFSKLCPVLFVSFLGLAACDDESSDDSSSVSYVQFYNGASNAPGLYLTLDNDLDEDDENYIERTYSAVDYAQATGRYEITVEEFLIELGWQSGDSTSRDDLSITYQDYYEFTEDQIHLMIASGDVQTPTVNFHSFDVIDDESDVDDSLSNVRFISLLSTGMSYDIYYSADDETYNEAQLLFTVSENELTENQKLEQGDYIFYITEAGATDVMFETEAVPYSYAAQYTTVLRSDTTNVNVPYALDVISSTGVASYIADEGQSVLRVYNAIAEHELLTDYQLSIDVDFISPEETIETDGLAYESFGDEYTLLGGDYAVTIYNTEAQSVLLQNHLMVLEENSNKTLFLYVEEEYIDDDGDGDLDEDNDGQVDEIEAQVKTLLVDNSLNQGIYEHNVNFINLANSDDFNYVSVYFVQNDETISTASNTLSATFGIPADIDLVNNTYQVYVVAKDGSSDLLLTSFTHILDEDSTEQFMILKADNTSATGYSVDIEDQTAN